MRFLRLLAGIARRTRICVDNASNTLTQLNNYELLNTVIKTYYGAGIVQPVGEWLRAGLGLHWAQGSYNPSLWMGKIKIHDWFRKSGTWNKKARAEFRSYHISKNTSTSVTSCLILFGEGLSSKHSIIPCLYKTSQNTKQKKIAEKEHIYQESRLTYLWHLCLWT
jgi:hypothetical protein